ncbi:MAG: DUF4262 domain-containing protein [Bacillus sp. (in: firmicutes)]
MGEKNVKKFGWHMDVILAKEYDNIHANYHTNGVKENFNHMDFQIVLSIDPEVANNIFFTLVDEINKGGILRKGKYIHK